MFPESKAISVVTLNTWKGDGAYLDRIKLIQEQAADLEADIMLLQEAFKAESCGYDTAKYLAEKRVFWKALKENLARALQETHFFDQCFDLFYFQSFGLLFFLVLTPELTVDKNAFVKVTQFQ